MWANCEGGFKEVSMSFHQFSGDTCEDPKHESILTAEDCAAAATSLRLAGRSFDASQMTTADWGPKGCYWNSAESTLILTSGTSQADSPSASLMVLCKERDTQALTSSAVGYSWYAALLPCALACLSSLSWASHIVAAA